MERTISLRITANGRHRRAWGRIWGLVAGGAALVAAGRAEAQSSKLPSDGAVAFSYARSADVIGCSQTTEVAVRDLILGVMHLDPFVPAGQSAAFSLKVSVSKPQEASIQAVFSLLDQAGSLIGTSVVHDETCDGAHLKLAASIALLLQPRPAAAPVCPPCPGPECDKACRESVEKDAHAKARQEIRAEELAKMRAELERELRARAEPAPSFRAVLGAGAVLGLNFGAEASPGFWLSGEVRSSWWSVALETRSLFPARAYTLKDGVSTVDIGSISALVTPCLRWRWLAGCGVVEVGGFWVAGVGAPSGDPKGVLFGLGLRARVDIPLGAGFEARVFADGIGHVVGLEAKGLDPSGAGGPAAYSFKAPREVSAFLGLGVAKVF